MSLWVLLFSSSLDGFRSAIGFARGCRDRRHCPAVWTQDTLRLPLISNIKTYPESPFLGNCSKKWDRISDILTIHASATMTLSAVNMPPYIATHNSSLSTTRFSVLHRRGYSSPQPTRNLNRLRRGLGFGIHLSFRCGDMKNISAGTTEVR